MSEHNQILVSSLTPEQRENVVRYQEDNKAEHRLVCPSVGCQENYMIPGVFTILPLFRQTVLQLRDDGMYCRVCEEIVQEWVLDFMTEYDSDVQAKFHADRKAKIDKECEEMARVARERREKSLSRVRNELREGGIEFIEKESTPQTYFHHLFILPAHPYIRLNMDYDGTVAIKYSQSDFEKKLDYRTVEYLWRDRERASVAVYVDVLSKALSSHPSYEVLPY